MRVTIIKFFSRLIQQGLELHLVSCTCYYLTEDTVKLRVLTHPVIYWFVCWILPYYVQIRIILTMYLLCILLFPSEKLEMLKNSIVTHLFSNRFLIKTWFLKLVTRINICELTVLIFWPKLLLLVVDFFIISGLFQWTVDIVYILCLILRKINLCNNKVEMDVSWI